MHIDADFVASIDWSKTPLGPMADWPQTLKGYTSLILGLPTPAIVFWGSELTQIYNDGYAVIMGPRHPRYYGGTFGECWAEAYPIIKPWMDKVLDEDTFVEVARAPITMTRHGFSEEAYFTFTLSPLRDDRGAVVGVYQPVVEMTEVVLQERRTETRSRLVGQKQPLIQARDVLDENPHDIPFAGIYLREEHGAQPTCLHCTGFVDVEEYTARLSMLDDAVQRAFDSNATVEAEVCLASRPWPEPVTRVVVVPVRRLPSDPPAAVIAFGVSPRLRFDDAYRSFLEGVAREIGTNLAAKHAEQAANAWFAREQAAREKSARRFSRLFEHAPVGIAVLRGPNHLVEVANPQCVALLSGHALLNRPIREALPNLDGSGIFEPLDQVYETGQPSLVNAVRLVLDTESGPVERFVDFAYQALPDDDGKPEGIVVVVFDVSELVKTRSDAEAASRAKDEFFAILGHELRNPLAPITTALQLMRLRGDDALVRERTIIERQVAQITRLVDDLLDVSRITRGKVELKWEVLELSEVVAKAIEMASPLLEQRRHHLRVEVPTRGLVVEGDPVRLSQVVSNLLTNAAKYTESGGRVRVTAERKNGQIALRVIDTGIGIGAEMLPRVFEAFAQDQQALDRAQGGLGLGLTIVANLVKMHGGTITVDSPGEGQGSTFTVFLPASDASVDTRTFALVPEPPPAESNSLRVLIVDDNEDAADMLGLALQRLGCSTRTAIDGAEALRLARELPPDVAVLDIGLPVMDGYELAGRLRGEHKGRPLRLIAVTGYGQESDKERAKEAGFDAHMVKPVDLARLGQLLESYRATSD